MAQVIDYEYIDEISTLDALRSLASDTTNGYAQDLPGVNTFLINAEAQAYNFPEGGLGIAGWSTDVKWTPGVGSILWSSGKIYLPDGTEISISTGYATVSAPTYIYVDTESGTVSSSSHGYDAVGENKIMICAAFPNTNKHVTFKAFGCGDQSSLVTGSDIAANTIVAGNIASGTITANEIHSNTITASEIASGAITASKINVSQLSAISANLGTITAGDITGTTVTAGNTSGTAIKLNPNNNRIEFYYNGSLVGYMAGGSVDGNGGILINADFAGMTGRDTFDLYNGMLRIPVGTNLYN